MLIALIVVIVVALVLGALLVFARSSLGELRTQSQERESALVDERDQLTRSKTNLERELSKAEEEIDELTGRAESRAVRIEKLEAELDAARAEGTEQQTTIDNQASEIDRRTQEMDALKADNNDLHERATAADTARAEAARRADEIEARYAGVPIDAIDTAEGAAPATLWGLELARSERTWRTSVAVDPTAVTGPFDDADDPVRLAVEIEAAALRENVGTYIAIDWQASPIDDPARRHLVVRVAQEMLEAAARNSAPLRLVVADDDRAEDGDEGEREQDLAPSTILLRLEPAEPSERATVDVDPITIPDVTDGVIDVDTENGLAVSVRAE